MPRKDHRHKLRVKAVTFDLWETLLFEKEGYSDARSSVRCKNLVNALKELGIEVSFEGVNFALNETRSSLLKIWDANRDVAHSDQIKLFIKHLLGNSFAVKEEWLNPLSSAYISALFEVPPYLNLDAHEILRWLKSRDKNVGIICNTGLTPGFGLKQFIERENIAKHFDVMMFSDEVGIRKPDSRIFLLAAEKLKVEPCKVVHVGDNLRTDVWGAKNAGFKAVHLLCESGRDRKAESNPTSLVSLSRKLGSLRAEDIVPDATINSLAILKNLLI
ncbi:MAG: HAD family hydrolase [Candidatus Bathyarchaeota archaeon]|jgi:putative hydrolase of the HAD superfamily|nr:HAD family hydrolase [Candidatus Bathyarchaeota archaeon A05DMB-3]MDH7607425.1 HAD family hydrolase [Candidatus Bathyarchaeota archaeon]